MKYRPEEQYLAMKYSYDELMSLANDVGDTAVLGYQRPKEAARNFFISKVSNGSSIYHCFINIHRYNLHNILSELRNFFTRNSILIFVYEW